MNKTFFFGILVSFIIGLVSGFCLGYTKGREDVMEIKIPKINFEWK